MSSKLKREKARGSEHLHRYPEQALSELAQFPAVDAAGGQMQAEFADFVRTSTHYTAKNNWDGHLIVGAIVLDRNMQRVALYNRRGTWEFPSGHITSTDKSLHEAAAREAVEKTRFFHDQLIPLHDGPVFLHCEEGKRGEGPAHPHYVASYLFTTHTDILRGGCEWTTPNGIAARLGANAQAYEGLTRALVAQLGNR